MKIKFNLFPASREGLTPIQRQSAGAGEENRTLPSSLIKLPYLGRPYKLGRVCFETGYNSVTAIKTN